MKKLLSTLLIALSCATVHAESTKTIFNPFTGKPDYITSVNGQNFQSGSGVTVTCTNGVCTFTGGGGSASSLQVTRGGVQISSPTSSINFSSNSFVLTQVGGSTATVALQPISLSTAVTGILLTGNGGTGQSQSGSISNGTLLIGNGSTNAYGNTQINSGTDCSGTNNALTWSAAGDSFGCNTLAPSSGSGNYIQNTSSLQSGATFYVSSGTVAGQLSVGNGSQTPTPLVVFGGKNNAQSTLMEIRNVGNSGAGTESRILFSEISSTTENGALSFTDRDGSLGGSFRIYLTPNGLPANEAEVFALNYAAIYAKAGLNIDSPGAILDVEGANSGSADSSPVLKLFSNNNNGTGDILDGYSHSGVKEAWIADNGNSVFQSSVAINGAGGLGVTYGVVVGSLTCTGSPCGSGGGGGSSSLAVLVNSVQVSSPTGSLGFVGPQVTSTNSGSSTTITIAGYLAGVTSCLTMNNSVNPPTVDINTGCVAQLTASNNWLGTNTFSNNIFISSGVLLNGAAGTSGQAFTSGGPGTIPSWTTISGGGTPASPVGSIQDNSAGSFGAIPGSFVGTSSVTIGPLSVTTSAVVSINPGDFLIAVSSSLTASTTAFSLDTFGNEVITGSMTVKQASFTGSGNLAFTNGSNSTSYQVVGSSTNPTTGHLAVWSSSWSVIDGGVAGGTSLSNPYTYTGSSFTMISSFSVTTNGAQNTTPGLVDIFDGVAYSGKPLLSIGTENQNNQIVIKDQTKLGLNTYGAQIGNLNTGIVGFSDQILDANSTGQKINYWNTGEMDLQTANAGDSGTNTNAIVLKPNEVTEVSVSSLNVVISTLTSIVSGNSGKYSMTVSTSVASAGGLFSLDISTTGHLNSQAVSGSTVTSCGTGPILVGSDIAGKITLGSGSVTSCVLTFAKPFINAPVCTVSDSSVSVEPDIISINNTQVNFGLSSTLGTGTIYYICIGSD